MKISIGLMEVKQMLLQQQQINGKFNKLDILTV